MLKTTLKIDGMMCGMCEAHINDCIRSHFKVEKVHSSHARGVCEILSASPLDEEKLREIIKNTGYTVTELHVEEEPEKKKGLFHLFH